MYALFNVFCTYIAAAFMVNFSQTTYSIDEDSGLVQPELVLSDSSLTSTTVHVFTTDGSATGNIHIHTHTLIYITYQNTYINDDKFYKSCR